MGNSAKNRKLGILIDERTVRVAEIEVSASGAKLLGAASVVAKTADETGWSAALSQAIVESNASSRTAFLALADRTVMAELVSLPQLKAADKKKVLARHAMRILNLKDGAEGCEYASRFLRELVKPEGKMEEHLLVAAPKATIERYLHLIQSAGLEIAAISPLAEALYAALSPSCPTGAEAEILVHFENAFTHVVLGAETSWRFTRDLAKTVDSSQLHSEADLRYGGGSAAFDAEMPIVFSESSDTSLPGSGTAFSKKETNDSALVPPLLLGEIRRTTLFLEKETGLKVRGIALSGPIRKRAGACEDLSSKLERPVRLAEEGLLAFRVEGEAPEGVLATYAPAAGAVLAGSRKDGGLNLLPMAMRPQTGISWARTGPWIGAAAALLGSIAFAAVTAIRLPSMEKDVERFRELTEKARQNRTSKEDPSAIAARSARMAAISQLKQNRSPIPYVLDELSRAIPTTLALSDIKLFRDESRWFFRIEGKVKEKGSLEEISSFKLFMKSLRQSPLFEKVDFTPFRKDRPDPKNPKPDDHYARFMIVGQLKGVGG